MRDFLKERYGSERSPAHMWFGVSVEDCTKLSRVRHLQQAPVGVRFLSIEPLLGPIRKLDLAGIDWVIVGGESGSGARPMERAWVRTIRDQCKAAGVVPIDCPYTFSDVEGLEVETRLARRMGYAAKSAVDIAHASIINTVLTPSGEEVARARRIVAEFERAHAEGRRAGRWQFPGGPDLSQRQTTNRSP